jgi:hypothetical protein
LKRLGPTHCWAHKRFERLCVLHCISLKPEMGLFVTQVASLKRYRRFRRSRRFRVDPRQERAFLRGLRVFTRRRTALSCRAWPGLPGSSPPERRRGCRRPSGRTSPGSLHVAELRPARETVEAASGPIQRQSAQVSSDSLREATYFGRSLTSDLSGSVSSGASGQYEAKMS